MAEFSIDRFVELYAERAAGMSASEVRALFAVASRPEIVSFAGGMPYVQALPPEDVLAVVADALDVHGSTILQYAGGQGHLSLRERLVPLMDRRGCGGRPRGHGDHHGRPAGARPDRQDLHRSGRPDRGGGARVRRRAHRVRRVPAPLPADRPRRGRDDRRPARGGARPRRAAEVRLHGARTSAIRRA